MDVINCLIALIDFYKDRKNKQTSCRQFERMNDTVNDKQMKKSMAGRAKEGQRDSCTLADDKDLGGLVSGGLWFGGLHLPEELLEDPHERLVVFGAEDFGDEGAAFGQELAG